MTKEFVNLTKEEIQAKIQYVLIRKTMQCSEWDSKQRKMAWDTAFTPEEQRKCERLGRLAAKWQRQGVPHSYIACEDICLLWQRLAEFCQSIA
jgi:hypothetical protein